MRSPREDWNDLEDIIVECIEDGRLDEGIAAAERALDHAEAEEPDNLAMKAQSLEYLGMLHQKKEDHATALTFLTRSLAVRSRIPDASERDLANCHFLIGRVSLDTGRFDEAEASYQRGLELFGIGTSPVDIDFVKRKDRLCELYLAREKFDKAEALYLETLHAFDEHKSDAIHRMRSRDNLGNLYQTIGAFDKAEKLFKQALKIAKQAFGEEDYCYAVAATSLGACHHGRKRYSKAEELYLTALRIKQEILGLGDGKALTELRNLRLLYADMNKPDIAKKFAERVDKIGRRPR
jgi:tetratricopeptide (TPR) repeat protein